MKKFIKALVKGLFGQEPSSVSTLSLLQYLKSSGGDVHRILGTEEGGFQSEALVGAQALCESIVAYLTSHFPQDNFRLLLNHPAVQIRQLKPGDGVASVQVVSLVQEGASSSFVSFDGSYVLCTIPPSLLAPSSLSRSVHPSSFITQQEGKEEEGECNPPLLISVSFSPSPPKRVQQVWMFKGLRSTCSFFFKM